MVPMSGQDFEGPPQSGDPEAVVLEYRGVRLDAYRYRVFADDREVSLTPTEFRLLRCLLSEPERVFSRAQLAEAVLLGATHRRGIDHHVSELRRKLGRPGLIKSVRGVGVRLE